MTLIACPDCSRRISDSAAACPGCSRPIRVYLPATPLRGDAVMEGLRAYVGPNWDSHYRYTFGQLLYAERKGLGAGWTWNWSAALTPYLIWFLYRRLFGAAGLFLIAAFLTGALGYFIASISPFGGLVQGLLLVAFSVAQGSLGDRLLFARAREAVGDGTSVPRAELARGGAPLQWVVWTSASVAALSFIAWFAFVVFIAFQGAVEAERQPASTGTVARTAARPDGWVAYQSAMGSFTAAFPHDPTYSTSVGARENRYTAEYRDGAVLQVTYEDDSAVGLEERFRQLEASPGVSGEIRPTPVALGEHPGMEATYEMGEGADATVVRHRIHQVGGRQYQLIATMRKADPAPAEVERFFSSFQLTGE
jgi:hypothetical protein